MNETDNELVDLIYSSVIGETSWDTFMRRLADVSGDGRLTLISHDTFKDEDMVGHYYKCDDSLVHEYESYFANVNPWVPQCVVRREGHAATGNDLVPRERFVKSEYFNDFFLPNNILDGAGISIVKNESRTIMLSVLTGDADQDATSRLARRLSFLYPHLRRAADYYRRGERQESSLGFGKAIFDAVDIGLVVVGDGLRPKSISESGMAMISGKNGLSITPVGRLRINDDGAQKLLGDMLMHSYAGPKTATFVVGELKLTLVHIVKDRISRYFEGPTVALLIEPVGGTFDPELFASTFHLTHAEIRALNGIVAGKAVDAIATEAGVSRETIRSQLKSLYLKTGVHSQSGLLRLVYAARSDSGS